MSGTAPMLRGGAAIAMLWLLAAAGCDATSKCGTSGSAGSDSATMMDGGHGEVQIGTPDPAGTLDFVALEADGDIPLQTFGQGGTHAALAVRCIGFGSEAFVEVVVENIATGEIVRTPMMKRPQLLLCRDADKHVCDDLPLNVMTGGLADPDKKDGLRVRITANVHNAGGLSGTATQEGVLRKDFDGGLPSR
jgi:hypothetical protein